MNSWYKALTTTPVPITYGGKILASRPSQSQALKDSVKGADSWVVVDDDIENWIVCSVVLTPSKLRLLKENHSSAAFSFDWILLNKSFRLTLFASVSCASETWARYRAFIFLHRQKPFATSVLIHQAIIHADPCLTIRARYCSSPPQHCSTSLIVFAEISEFYWRFFPI